MTTPWIAYKTTTEFGYSDYYKIFTSEESAKTRYLEYLDDPTTYCAGYGTVKERTN